MKIPEFYELSAQHKVEVSTVLAGVDQLVCPLVPGNKFVALFDGTENSIYSADPLLEGEQLTLIGRLSLELTNKDPLTHVQYVAGVGAPLSAGASSTGSALSGDGCVQRAEMMYCDLVDYASQLPPGESFYIDVAGFSRGAATARHFMNIVDERGVVSPNGSCLFAPGTLRMSALLLDTVSTGQEKVLKQGIPECVDSVLHLVAADEERSFFRLTSVLAAEGDNSDQRLNELYLPGVHNDVGGGWESFAALTAELAARAYLTKLGIPGAANVSATTVQQAMSVDATWWTNTGPFSGADMPDVVPHDGRHVQLYMTGDETVQDGDSTRVEQQPLWRNEPISATRAQELQALYGSPAGSNRSGLLDSWLFGMAGKSLEGSTGSDHLYGWGSTLLAGGLGEDIYILQGGESVIDLDRGGELHLPAGESPLTFARDGGDLLITWGDSAVGQVRVVDWLLADGTGSLPKFFVTTDVGVRPGSPRLTYDTAEITKTILSAVGGRSADTLTGIIGYSNTLQGAEGNDTLIAVGQGDTLNGGLGNDELVAQVSSAGTTFVFGDQSELDTLLLVNSAELKVDTLRVTSGRTAADLSFGVQSSLDGASLDLVIGISMSTAKFIIQDYLNNRAASGSTMIDRILFDDGSVLSKAEILARIPTVIVGTPGNDATLKGNGSAREIYGLAGDDVITGSAIAETIYGGSGADVIDGGSGSDVLRGGAGADKLGGSSSEFYGGGNTYEGGPGSDKLYGTYSGDTYLFTVGDGHDVLTENSGTNSSVDRLVFGAEVQPTDILVRRVESNLVLAHRNGEDSVTILNWYTSKNGYAYQIERVLFADGTDWAASTLTEQGLTVLGTELADNLIGHNVFDDVLLGQAGNDILTGNGGADILEGGDGDDVLDGGSGSDILRGGAGSDKLGSGSAEFYGGSNTYEGGSGADNLYGTYSGDTYLFNQGDGADTLTESAAATSAVDVLRFGVGLSAASLSAIREGVNLRLSFGGGVDSILITNWFSAVNPGSYQVESLQFADGIEWTASYVTQLAVPLVGVPAAMSDVFLLESA